MLVVRLFARALDILRCMSSQSAVSSGLQARAIFSAAGVRNEQWKCLTPLALDPTQQLLLVGEHLAGDRDLD